MRKGFLAVFLGILMALLALPAGSLADPGHGAPTRPIEATGYSSLSLIHI